MVVDFTISPDDVAEYTAPIVIVRQESSTFTPTPDFYLSALVSGTGQHQSLVDLSVKALLSAADILEASKDLGIDEEHESYAQAILRESRLKSKSVKL